MLNKLRATDNETLYTGPRVSFDRVIERGGSISLQKRDTIFRKKEGWFPFYFWLKLCLFSSNILTSIEVLRSV